MKLTEEKFSLIKSGTVEILPESELSEKLSSKRPLRIKAGFDPTAPDLHLGHAVILRKLSLFQELGHQVIFLIGDFTALIGDPSGKNKTRPRLTHDEILKNSETYKSQISSIIDLSKLEIHFNSSWMNEMTATDFIHLTSQYTIARMLERDDFEKRYTNKSPISIHEFIYPLIQGYDSIALEADIEIGGTDQKFNLLVGRHLQRIYGKNPQSIITMPTLEGLDGTKKMSKSLGNHIGIREEPGSIFRKILSMSDGLIWRYFDLLSGREHKEIEAYKEHIKSGGNPKDIKIKLAEEIIAWLYDEKVAYSARFSSGNRIKGNKDPDNMPEIELESQNDQSISSILNTSNIAKNAAAARDLLLSGRVKVDREKVDISYIHSLGATHIYQAGRKIFARITLRKGASRTTFLKEKH